MSRKKKFKPGPTKKRLKPNEILDILKCKHDYPLKTEVKPTERTCPIYHIPCRYPQETPHYTCLTCGGILATHKKGRNNEAGSPA